MPDYSGLVRAIKQAGTEAVDAGNPVTICYGKVISISPLKVKVDQKMTLGSAQITLAKRVVDDALMTGDDVIMLRQQGGQKYIIIDKVG